METRVGMSASPLYDLLLLVNQGIEQGLEKAECRSSILALAVNEVDVVIPFQLLFQRGAGFFALTTGLPVKLNPSTNLARISIQYGQTPNE
jgi:hypothetical protein